MTEQRLNPYTQAMLNCVKQFDQCDDCPELDETTGQFLANMVQGRFLQFLVNRLTQFYHITDKDLEKKLTLVLMTILSDKFFVVFREKVKAKPEIVYKIAKKITQYEQTYSNHPKKMDALFHWICKKYFEYQHIDIILKWINTNPEVEKIIFLSHVQDRIKDAALIKALFYIMQNDKDGVTPSVFNRYLVKNKIDRLDNLVKTGEWRIEASFVHQQSSKMITWQNYMNSVQH